MNELRLLVALARAKQRFPSMRMTQIICNATNTNDPFYVTDDALTEALEHYCAEHSIRTRRSTDR